MGKVLSFQPRRKSVSKPLATKPSASSVVIFPGIRYERLTSAETVASKLRLPDLGPMPSPMAP